MLLVPPLRHGVNEEKAGVAMRPDFESAIPV
jgi:hypothetical protein